MATTDAARASACAPRWTIESAIASAYVLGADGTKYFPRLESVDPATNRATFLMLDGLTNGRFLIGIGPSNPQVIEGWHGVPYGKPLQHLTRHIFNRASCRIDVHRYLCIGLAPRGE